MIKYLLAIIFFAFTYTAYGQNSDSYKYWFTFGSMINRDVSMNLSYSFSLNGSFYKVGYFIRGGFSQNPTVGNNGFLFNSVDVSFGKRLQSEWFQISAFIGPSFVFGTERTSSDTLEKFNTAGIETDLQFLFRPANEIGIGISFYGNANFMKNFTGININLTLGNGK